jgi:hypothetical protein
MRCSSCVPFLNLASVPLYVPALAALVIFSPAAMSGAESQTSTAAPAAARGPDVSKEALVFEKYSERVREEADGTGTQQTRARIHVLADAGVKQMAVLAFTYTASSQQLDIGYVRVVKPDGSIVVTPDYNIQDMPADVTREAPMYSDIHQKHVAVRGLGVGDTLEYKVTLRTVKPDVPGQFWFEYSFEKNLIVLDEQLDLDVPADKPVTVTSAGVQPTITSAAGRKLYHWASSNLARPDPDAPARSKKDRKPSVQATTFTTWAQVGDWYDSLQKNALIVTPAIQAHADALAKGLTSEEDKIKVIFNDVALHVHYVALDFGIGRYQPHPADDVLANEYGDCKDKHTLLVALLKAEGIEAWPVLISSSRDIDPETPSPGQFDHVITVVPLQDKLLWMDSTEEVVPPGELMAVLRDKQALVIPVGKPAYLERTPADLPYVQSAEVQVEGKLSDQGMFTAHFVENYHGDAELALRAAFRSVPQSQWKQFLQGMSNATGFAGEVKNPEVSPIEKIGKPLQFSYDYSREKYGQWDDRRISPPLPPVGWELAPGIKQKKPADDIETGGPGDQVYKATVQLPPGWLLFPPPATNLVQNWAEYHATYTFKDGTFAAERRLIIKKDSIPLSDWDQYLAFRRAIYEDEVRMEGLSNPGAPPLPAAGNSFDSDVTSFRQELSDSIGSLRSIKSVLQSQPAPGSDNLKKASDDSRQALESIESKSTTLLVHLPQSLYWGQALSYAWCIRGWSALEMNDVQTALSYLRAAWSLSQDPLSGYLLARTLETSGNKVAAAHQYELAAVTNANSPFSTFSSFESDLARRAGEGYRRVTGKELHAKALNGGSYNGSLQSELDRQLEIQKFLQSTKLTGTGLFSLAFRAGTPVKATFLSGDKGFAALVQPLQAHAFSPELPAGSKALLLREVRIICSPWAGCDASLLRTGSLEMPTRIINVTPPNAPKGARTLRVEQLPVAPSSN